MQLAAAQRRQRLAAGAQGWAAQLTSLWRCERGVPVPPGMAQGSGSATGLPTPGWCALTPCPTLFLIHQVQCKADMRVQAHPDTLLQASEQCAHERQWRLLRRAIAIANEEHACKFCFALLNHPNHACRTPAPNKNCGLRAGRAPARFAATAAWIAEPAGHAGESAGPRYSIAAWQL